MILKFKTSGFQPARISTPHRDLFDPHAVADRLANWSEQARQYGRVERAEQLLLKAWEAYDLRCKQQTDFRI